MPGVITSGMDIELVTQLANEMRTAAQQVKEIQNRITTKLRSVPWEGPDKKKFEGEWDGQYTAALNAVVNGLTQAAQVATVNASQQTQASGN